MKAEDIRIQCPACGELIEVPIILNPGAMRDGYLVVTVDVNDLRLREHLDKQHLEVFGPPYDDWVDH